MSPVVPVMTAAVAVLLGLLIFLAVIGFQAALVILVVAGVMLVMAMHGGTRATRRR
jgi:hypothetical protein